MPLVVDNTVPTPILLRPIEHGADIVVHSLTKFMGGHGAVMGGMVVDGGRFDWTANAARFPMFSEPDESYHGLVYTERFGAAAYAARMRSVYQRTTGAVLAPMNAFTAAAGHRDGGAARRAARRERPQGRAIPEGRSAHRLGELRRVRGEPLLRPGATSTWAARPLPC